MSRLLPYVLIAVIVTPSRAGGLGSRAAPRDRRTRRSGSPYP